MNLISVRRLTERGNVVHFNDGEAAISKDGVTFAVAKLKEGVYWLNFNLKEKSCANLSTTVAQVNSLWHRRLGHLDMRNVVKLAKEDLATGIDPRVSDELGVCDCCLKGNMTRSPFTGTRKQAPRCWNKRFDEFITNMKFVRSKSDHCLYTLIEGNSTMYLIVYVDDVLACSNDIKLLDAVQRKLFTEFEMKNLGTVKHFVGLRITYDGDTMKIDQQQYAERLLEAFQMSNCNPAVTPLIEGIQLNKGADDETTEQPFRELVGSLMYLMLGSRSDLCYALNYYSRFQDKATDDHYTHLKRVLRYVKGTLSLGLIYKRDNGQPILCGYVDSDFASDVVSRKSTSGFLVTPYDFW